MVKGKSEAFRSWRSLFLGLVVTISAGCGAGNGSTGAGGGPAEPNLDSIQSNIFTPVCSRAGCHTGTGAPQGLRLSSSIESFSDLVSVPSVELPDVLRVAPGQPDSSYLLWKLEGRSGIQGQRMPAGGLPSLSASQISVIKQWIQAGAPR